MAKYQILENFVMNGVQYSKDMIVELDYQRAHLNSIKDKIKEVPIDTLVAIPETPAMPGKPTVNEPVPTAPNEGQLAGETAPAPAEEVPPTIPPTVPEETPPADEQIPPERTIDGEINDKLNETIPNQ